MKNTVFFFIFVFITLLAGCSNESTSIYGEILYIEENTFKVDCSEQVKKTDMSDVGYSCLVQITDKTTFRNQNREKLHVKDFTEESIVQVILTEPKTISQNKNSREVEAKEIILIND